MEVKTEHVQNGTTGPAAHAGRKDRHGGTRRMPTGVPVLAHCHGLLLTGGRFRDKGQVEDVVQVPV